MSLTHFGCPIPASTETNYIIGDPVFTGGTGKNLGLKFVEIPVTEGEKALSVFTLADNVWSPPHELQPGEAFSFSVDSPGFGKIQNGSITFQVVNQNEGKILIRGTLSYGSPTITYDLHLDLNWNFIPT